MAFTFICGCFVAYYFSSLALLAKSVSNPSREFFLNRFKHVAFSGVCMVSIMLLTFTFGG